MSDDALPERRATERTSSTIRGATRPLLMRALVAEDRRDDERRRARGLLAGSAVTPAGVGTLVAWSSAMKQIADALELLTEQHEVISVELARVGTVQPSEWAYPLGELADQVATHLAIEEQFLSTLGIAVDAAGHNELRSALADLLVVDLSSPAAAEQLARLTERWTAHSTAQDHSIFVALAELLTPEMLQDVGLQLGAWAAQSRCIAA